MYFLSRYHPDHPQHGQKDSSFFLRLMGWQ